MTVHSKESTQLDVYIFWWNGKKSMHFWLIRLLGSMKISLSSNEICENSCQTCHESQKLLYAPKGRQKLWHQWPYQFWKRTNQSLWQTLKHSIYIRTVTSKSMDFVRSHFGKMNLWAVEHYFSSFCGTWSTRSVQLVKGSSFQSDFLQNPCFSFP